MIENYGFRPVQAAKSDPESHVSRSQGVKFGRAGDSVGHITRVWSAVNLREGLFGNGPESQYC